MLAECHSSILQRIIDACDGSDLFLLRQVCRRFRDAVGLRIKRLAPVELEADIGARFPSLTHLDISRFQDVWASPHLGPALAQLSQLRDLRFLPPWSEEEACLTRLEALHSLPSLPHLTRLHLTSEWDQDDVLLSLAARCSSLQYLSLSSEEMSWDTLRGVVAHVAGTLTGLELITITLVDDDPRLGLRALNTGRLQSLKIHGSLVTVDSSTGEELSPDAVNAELACFTSLSALDLAENPYINDEGIWRLNALTGLTRLHLNRTDYSYGGLRQLTRLTRVVDLDIETTTPRSTVPNEPLNAMPALAGFPNLASLNVRQCWNAFGDGPFAALATLTRLTAEMTDLMKAPQALRGLSLLEDLSIESCLTHASQLRHLSDLVSLTRLVLGTSGGELHLSAEDVRPVAQLRKLRRLCFERFFALNHGAVEQLGRLPSLQALDLSWVRLDAAHVTLLQRLPLEWLRLPLEWRGTLEPDQLPPQLRVPLLKGQRIGFWWLDDDRLPYILG